MSSDQLSCPDCGTQLRHVTDGGIRNECPSCSGRLWGLSPFERQLDVGIGAGIWVSTAETEANGPPCPFCAKPTRHPAAANTAPKGLAVCRMCQQVWVPAAAGAWMQQNAPAGSAGLPAQAAAATPSQCGNCGAPYEPDEQGQCRFCHAQLSAPEAPVIINMGPQVAMPRTGSRLLDGLAAMLIQPVE